MSAEQAQAAHRDVRDATGPHTATQSVDAIITARRAAEARDRVVVERVARELWDQDNLHASWPLAHPSERRAHRERAILLVNAAYRVLGLDPAPAHLRDEPLHPVPGQPGPVTADNDPELARLRAESDRLRSLLHGGGPE